MTTHNNIINGSTFLLIIIGLWLWTVTTVAFQLQYQQAANSNSRKFMRHSRLYSSEIDDDDDENDDVPIIVPAPEQEIEKVFSREIYERKRIDFDVRQSYGGKSLASTLVCFYSGLEISTNFYSSISAHPMSLLTAHRP